MEANDWLLATVAFVAVMWMPYVLDRMARIGVWRTLGNPTAAAAAAQSGWALRAKAAHANAAENLVTFAPLVLLATASGRGATALAAGAAATNFWARLVHFVVYSMGLPVVRTVAFLVAFGAQAALLVALMQAAP